MPAMTVTGRRGTVQRIRATVDMDAEFPYMSTDVVDLWLLPGGMRMAVLGGTRNGYALVLAYLQPDFRALCTDMGLPESLCVDVWHVQRLPGCGDATQAREIALGLARAVANGGLDPEPIQQAQREVWAVAVASVAAVITGQSLRDTKIT